MNGFKVIAGAYRKLASEGGMSHEEAEKKCKAFDFLKDCDRDDIYNLFDSSAFNEIVKSYLNLTLDGLVSESVINNKQANSVRDRFILLLGENKSSEIKK